MYRLYLTNDKYTICNFKCTGDSMEDCYNEYGKELVENGLKQGYSIQSQKEKYNLFIFPKIRNITRFTFSETVSAKENLEKNNKIDLFKGKAISVKKYKSGIYIKTDKKKYLKKKLLNQ